MFTENPNVADRQRRLSRYNFTCRCEACVYDYNAAKLNFGSISPQILPRSSLKNYDEVVQKLKENCRYIEDHADNIFTADNYEVMRQNIFLINLLGYLETFPR
jgi:hypothetical protein